jgi:hypothetical protein
VSALLELAERCEAATDADIELDLDITKALGLAGRSALTLTRFTASIDAALTLVPEGWDRQVAYWARTGLARAWLVRDGKTTEGNAKTEALAICAAALRARTTQ